jgi:succinate dehydrogenase hydrophobic anchor subunit
MQNQMIEAKDSGQDRAGAVWLVQALTGILLVLLLLLHMVAHHFIVEGGLRDFQQVIDYIRNPAIFTISIIFLIVVGVHAMLGLRAIVIDMRPSTSTRKIVDWAFAFITVAIVVYGIWLEVAIAGM